MKSRYDQGFTLIELLIALSVVGILLGVAVNGYSSWLLRAKTEDVITSLQRSLSHARSEAIKHGGRIRLCGSSNGSTCGLTFNDGWIVFLDVDGSTQVNESESVIGLFRIDDEGFDIEVTDAADDEEALGISYNHRGYSDMAVSITVSRYEITRSFTMRRSGYIE